MAPMSINQLKKLFRNILIVASVMLFSCQESTNKDDNERNRSEDTVTTGLEGTRDQAAQVGGADVKIDTSAGETGERTGGTGGLPGRRDSSSNGSGNTSQFLSEEVAGNYA